MSKRCALKNVVTIRLADDMYVKKLYNTCEIKVNISYESLININLGTSSSVTVYQNIVHDRLI